MKDLLEQNIYEIEGLNQRGGRMLSVVDLIEDGTLDEEMAGYLLYSIARGASFLTAAGPGGVGKSTLLASLLNFLPPDVRITTLSDAELINGARRSPPSDRCCFLAHEIGSGSWFAYIWGEDVESFLSLKRDSHYVASCIHADTIEEFYDVMGHTLRVSNATLRKLDLVLFMTMMRGLRRHRRRVSTVYRAGDDEHQLVYQWDRKRDKFERKHAPSLERNSEAAEGVSSCTEFIKELMAGGERDFAAVRGSIIEFYLESGSVLERFVRRR